jgi:hypothetical protein
MSPSAKKRRAPSRRKPSKAGEKRKLEVLAKARATRMRNLAARKAEAARKKAELPSVTTSTSLDERLEKAAQDVKKATHEEVQGAIDNWTSKGDEARSQMDSSNVRRVLDAADRADLDAATDHETGEVDASFLGRYEQASTTGLGYLKRSRGEGNRTILVPPNMQIHPTIGAWGYLYHGHWMMMRWAYTGPKNNLQRKIQRGYQFFEGRDWCLRLGLLPEVYMNRPDNRINYQDLTLMWHTDAYIAKHIEEATVAHREAREAVNQKIVESVGGPIKGVTVLEGRDEDVMKELKSRKEAATGTKVSMVVP